MNNFEHLSSLPAVDQLLRCPELADLRRSQPHDLVVDWIRAAILQLRSELLEGRQWNREELWQQSLQFVERRWRSDTCRQIQPVINATGIILHTNLGRAPLAPAAMAHMQGACSYTNLELDLESGKRHRRAARVMELLAQVTGAEDALVVNNCAGATVLALQSLATGREVIISRGQLVEIGGGFRLPDVFQAAGVRLRDVGTTNRTYLRDYEAAVGESTGAIIRVHRSNFAQIGFVTEPTIQELVGLRRTSEFPIIDDLGSGCLYDLSKFGLDEPSVRESVKVGADLSLFSGDKLFGGPQCGIVVGKKQWLERLRSSPMMRALRADKVTLAALEATTEIHLAGQAFEQLPVLQMLSANSQEIHERCVRAREQLSPGPQSQVAVVACQSQLGGGTLPGQTLASHGLSISDPHLDRLAQRLRLGSPAIQARLSDDRLVLDFRTIDNAEIDPLIHRLNALLGDRMGDV